MLLLQSSLTLFVVYQLANVLIHELTLKFNFKYIEITTSLLGDQFPSHVLNQAYAYACSTVCNGVFTLPNTEIDTEACTLKNCRVVYILHRYRYQHAIPLGSMNILSVLVSLFVWHGECTIRQLQYFSSRKIVNRVTKNGYRTVLYLLFIHIVLMGQISESLTGSFFIPFSIVATPLGEHFAKMSNSLCTFLMLSSVLSPQPNWVLKISDFG